MIYCICRIHRRFQKVKFLDIKILLSQLAEVLFFPVVVLLLLLVGWMVMATGMFLRSGIARMRGRRPALDRYFAKIDAAANGPNSDAELDVESVLQDAELAMTRMLNRTRFAVRVGPSLGLIGTLIPMAIALGGLAAGDLPSLASNMVTAFSSTIVGIAVGIVAYLLTLARDSWVRADMNAIRIHAERAVLANEQGT